MQSHGQEVPNERLTVTIPNIRSIVDGATEIEFLKIHITDKKVPFLNEIASDVVGGNDCNAYENAEYRSPQKNCRVLGILFAEDGNEKRNYQKGNG